MATQVGNRDMTVSNFAVVPNKIKAKGQAVLTVHSISGRLCGTDSSVTGEVACRCYW